MPDIIEDDIYQFFQYIEAHAEELALAIAAEVATGVPDISEHRPGYRAQPVLSD